MWPEYHYWGKFELGNTWRDYHSNENQFELRNVDRTSAFQNKLFFCDICWLVFHTNVSFLMTWQTYDAAHPHEVDVTIHPALKIFTFRKSALVIHTDKQHVISLRNWIKEKLFSFSTPNNHKSPSTEQQVPWVQNLKLSINYWLWGWGVQLQVNFYRLREHRGTVWVQWKSLPGSQTVSSRRIRQTVDVSSGDLACQLL